MKIKISFFPPGKQTALPYTDFTPQMLSIVMAKQKPKPVARNSVDLSCGWQESNYLEHHLLPARGRTNRQPEQGAEPGLEPRRSATERGQPQPASQPLGHRPALKIKLFEKIFDVTEI